MNYWSVGSQDAMGESYPATSETYTRSYTAGLLTTDWYISEWGAPPFVPVTITAGAEKTVVSASSTRTTVGGGGGSESITAAPTGAGKEAGVSQTSSESSTSSTVKSGCERLRYLSAVGFSGLLMVWTAGIAVV
jgi:hypothetical protein